jgi:hypothetical protein
MQTRIEACSKNTNFCHGLKIPLNSKHPHYTRSNPRIISSPSPPATLHALLLSLEREVVCLALWGLVLPTRRTEVELGIADALHVFVRTSLVVVLHGRRLFQLLKALTPAGEALLTVVEWFDLTTESLGAHGTAILGNGTGLEPRGVLEGMLHGLAETFSKSDS